MMGLIQLGLVLRKVFAKSVLVRVSESVLTQEKRLNYAQTVQQVILSVFHSYFQLCPHYLCSL